MGSGGALEGSVKVTAEWRVTELRRGGSVVGDVAALQTVGNEELELLAIGYLALPLPREKAAPATCLFIENKFSSLSSTVWFTSWQFPCH